MEDTVDCFAAVITGKGTGAISTIQLFGDSAGDVINKIFEPAGKKPAKLEAGRILLGAIHDGDKILDQVTIGCEHLRTFAINCHGNPLIVEMIMQLLRRHGAEILSDEQLQIKILSEQKDGNTIATEAKLAQPKAKTLEGTKIITNQVNAGLSKTAQDWLEHIKEISTEEILNQASQILRDTQTAKLIIYGCTAVLAGPPNSGKRSLLNCLSGRQNSIVTDIKGTTRDWVRSQCKLSSLSLELIDTAGLDELLTTSENSIEKYAQKKTAEVLEKADLILLVLDNSQSADQLDKQLVEKIADKRIVTVLNKSDLPAGLDTNKLPKFLSNTALTSATEGTGIENLTEKIRLACSIVDFDLHIAVCFTDRQKNLIRQLETLKSKEQAAPVITELLNGKI
jgi:tRNA modification GTPase